MCPLCIAGIAFIAHLFAIIRWFKRVVLKKTVENEAEYWVPSTSWLTPRMAALYANKKKRRLVFIVMGIEIAVCIILARNGGFMWIGRLIEMMK